MSANNESLLEKLLTRRREAPPAGVRGLSSEGVIKGNINGNIRGIENHGAFLTGLIGLK